MPARNWEDAEEKRFYCLVCGTPERVELAHVSGRKFDRPKKQGQKTLWVNPDDVVPLCGPFPEGCHGNYDHYRLDLLPYLTVAEQVRAVECLGGIEAARRRLCPSEYREIPT